MRLNANRACILGTQNYAICVYSESQNELYGDMIYKICLFPGINIMKDKSSDST